MTSALRPPGPVVGLAVEPRLLGDALARALTAGGITVVDTDGTAEPFDVLVTSRTDEAPGVAQLVIFVDPTATSDGTSSVSDLVQLISSWPSGGEAVEVEG